MDSSDAIIRIAWDSMAKNYSYIAGLSVLMYDMVLMLDREWELVWRARWTVGKGLYLAIRYYSAIVLTLYFVGYTAVYDSLFMCVGTCMGFGSLLLLTANRHFKDANSLMGIAWSGSVFISLLIEIVTAMRLFALYNGTKTILFVLLFIILPTSSVHLYAAIQLARELVRTSFFLLQTGSMQGCFALTDKNYHFYTVLLWSTSLLSSVAQFLLLAFKFIKVYRRRRTPRPPSDLSPLLIALYRSGTVWFMSLAAGTVAHAVTSTYVKGPLIQAVVPWLVVCQAISGTRLLLDLYHSDAYMYKVHGSYLTTPDSQPVELDTLWFQMDDPSTGEDGIYSFQEISQMTRSS